LALSAGIADVYKQPLNRAHFQRRINFLIGNWAELHVHKNEQEKKTYKTPFGKRVFDVFFAGLALLMLSPLFLIVIILLKFESKGPVFYYSPRVGTGYRVFKFYKFRSMYVNADKKLKDLKHLNQYSAAPATETNTIGDLCEECRVMGTKCQFPLYADNNKWCEKQYLYSKKSQAGSAFIKLKNDPRITKVGKIIRNTSIDELPQLWNVIIGDMSIVGNRPLPLYEAEKLTTDKYALRFLAPAGITGLWQVEKRGKGEMSEDERLMLDNKYAENHSLANDIRLILKTIPALFQKENV
jgi:lipopolysaccharide/colanic/teichoic acid biosynthesis glycosyltransferase